MHDWVVSIFLISFFTSFFSFFGVDVNECTSKPCVNGGSCHDNVNAYRCLCLGGFTGSQCQIGMYNYSYDSRIL